MKKKIKCLQVTHTNWRFAESGQQNNILRSIINSSFIMHVPLKYGIIHDYDVSMNIHVL